MRKSFLIPITASLPTKKADLINHLWPRFLEYGKGLCFMTSQERIYTGSDTLNVDLVLYHRGLKCIVPVILGRGLISDAQMDKAERILYYYATEDRRDSGGNPPLAVVINRHRVSWLIDYVSYGDSVDLLSPDIERELPSLEDLKAILG